MRNIGVGANELFSAIIDYGSYFHISLWLRRPPTKSKSLLKDVSTYGPDLSKFLGTLCVSVHY